jgi:hypothetical protein
LKPAQIVRAILSQKNPSQKRAGGLVQGVGPEFKPQYQERKKEKAGRKKEKKEKKERKKKMRWANSMYRQDSESPSQKVKEHSFYMQSNKPEEWR